MASTGVFAVVTIDDFQNASGTILHFAYEEAANKFNCTVNIVAVLMLLQRCLEKISTI